MSSSFYNGPCKGCDKRSLGCHSKCKPYLDWKAARDEKKADIKKRKDMEIKLNEADFKRLTKKWRNK